MEAQRQMPQYQSHKKVWALKIAELTPQVNPDPNSENDGSWLITPTDTGFAPIVLDYAFVAKHKPKVGGYYVVYEDGYKSWSPAEAFETGYTRI